MPPGQVDRQQVLVLRILGEQRKVGWIFVFTNLLNNFYGNIYVPCRDV